MNADQPEMRQIDSWQAAEENAAAWMRYWGYTDARVTIAGADGGIDVAAHRALAQVKFEAKQVGAPVLQQLVGAAARDVTKRLFFFTGAGYAQPALEYAEAVNIALFKYNLTGRMTPVSSEARRVVEEGGTAGFSSEAHAVRPPTRESEFDRIMDKHAAWLAELEATIPCPHCQTSGHVKQGRSRERRKALSFLTSESEIDRLTTMSCGNCDKTWEESQIESDAQEGFGVGAKRVYRRATIPWEPDEQLQAAVRVDVRTGWLDSGPGLLIFTTHRLIKVATPEKVSIGDANTERIGPRRAKVSVEGTVVNVPEVKTASVSTILSRVVVTTIDGDCVKMGWLITPGDREIVRVAFEKLGIELSRR